ncbi:MAG: hypothetical protein JJE18_09055 [Eubacteriaceae bacterium]|nr:hypothetical protein [Eubacteriaceae bacterium]
MKKRKGSFFLAPSGTEKTTLVKMLMGFIVPDAGEIIVNGLRLSGDTMTAIVYQIVIMAAILISRYFSIHLSILLTRKTAFDAYDCLKI